MERKITHQKNLGAFIHDARTKSGLTQQELAQRAKVSREWISGIEQGKRPRAELGKVLDLLKVLGVDITLSWSAAEGAHSPKKTTHDMPDIIFPTDDQLSHLVGETRLQQEVRATLEGGRKS